MSEYKDFDLLGGLMEERHGTRKDYEAEINELKAEIDRLKEENAELGADKIHLIQAQMDGGDICHYTAHDIGYRDLEKKCKALEADYLVSNRELLILQAEIERLQSERRWIPVSERLPEDKQRVFIVTKSGNFSHTVFEKGYFAWEENIPFKELAIAYWMPMFELPLPLPPEGDA